jgi:peptidoglycan/LPS O-acetylase OafA/YrhL
MEGHAAKALAPRIPELDGLRGLAVGAVLTWHFIGAMLDPSLGTWTRGIYHLTILGRTGVDLFFVLSGFLITGIILDRQKQPAAFLGAFYLRRVLRIVPSYALLVVLFWAVVATGANSTAFNPETPWWRHATFTQNLWMTDAGTWGPGAISVTWSVAIEEQFYLAFPLLLLLTPRRWVPCLLLAIGAASCAYRAAAWVLHGEAFRMYVYTLSRLDGLACGALIAWLWREDWFSPWLDRTWARVTVLFRVLALVFPLLAFAMAVNLPLAMSTWGHTYLTLFYGLCLLLVLRCAGRPGLDWLRHRRLRQLGAISYTAYLFHPLLLSLVFVAAFRPEKVSTATDAALAFSALVLTLLWSAVSLRWLEAPLTTQGRRWSY